MHLCGRKVGSGRYSISDVGEEPCGLRLGLLPVATICHVLKNVKRGQLLCCVRVTNNSSGTVFKVMCSRLLFVGEMCARCGEHTTWKCSASVLLVGLCL